MRRIVIGTIALVLLAGALPMEAHAQQDHQNLAIVYKLLLDQQAWVIPASAAQYGAIPGALLNNGDQVITDINTRAAIRFTDDGSIIRMNPDSELRITAEGERSALRKTINIDVGELWAKVNRREGAEYRIETPTAVAAVKGTEFYVRVGPNGETTIITTDGVLDFFTGVGTVEISAGTTGTVLTATEAPAVAQTQPGEVQSFGDLAGEDEGGDESEFVEIVITFMDASGNQKTMTILLPRAEARQYLPPAS